MEQDHQPDISAQTPARVNRVVHHIAGGEVVVETFTDGSVRVNGDLVTPARELTLVDQANPAQ
jgi:hypothetical protein